MARYLVTGASRGIGRAVVELLAGEHEVIALGRSLTSLAQLPVRSLLVADLSDPSALAGLIPEFDSLDGLVHCAGVARRGGLDTASVEQWTQYFAINVVSPAELTRLVLPALRAARATIVFVNSGQGQEASGQSTVYATTKFALRGLADSLRRGEPDLRVCSVFPGRVATDMQRALREQENGPFEPQRYLTPATVATLIVDVLSAPPDAVVADVTVRPR